MQGKELNIKGQYEYLTYAAEQTFHFNDLGCKLCSLCAAANSQRGRGEELEVVGGEIVGAL